MTRAEGWDVRLLETVAAWEHIPFAWGSTDCLGFALACIAAMRGEAEIARPAYGSPEEADAVLLGLGARRLENLLMMHLEPVAMSFAGRGDIGIVEQGGRQCAAVNTGPFFVGKTGAGLIRLPRHLVTRAFRV